MKSSFFNSIQFNSYHNIHRNFVSFANVYSQQILTKEYLEKFQPRSLKRIKILDETPPSDLNNFFHIKLNKAYSNPRSILKIYKEYIDKTDYPSYNFLLRAFCQLGNTFGFNSFWSLRDKQVLQNVLYFKYLLYDLIERKQLIQPRDVPRLLYSLAALEYRSHYLLPKILELLIKNLHEWKTNALCIMSLSLALLGIGDNTGENSFGSLPNSQFTLTESRNANFVIDSSNDYTGLIEIMCTEIHSRMIKNSDSIDIKSLTPFDLIAPAFALAISDIFNFSDGCDDFIPLMLSKCCEKLSLETLEQSGWIQYYMYMILYMSDVFKPINEVKIKKAIPFNMQKNLHIRWLQDILLHSQPQGSELIQSEVDEIINMKELNTNNNILINCSVGRESDEQHCIFASHLVKDRKLVIEYDYFHPLGFMRPKVSGMMKNKLNFYKHFGYNVAVIHKCFWDILDLDQKEAQMQKLLARFHVLNQKEKPKFALDCEVKDEKPCDPIQDEGKNILVDLHQQIKDEKFLKLKHKRNRFDTWPPEKIMV